MDCDKNLIQGNVGKRNEEGIKQKFEKKEGLFCKNMMGKCVNFVVRLVISFDFNIEMFEIGVLFVFVVKFIYLEFVIYFNFKDF